MWRFKTPPGEATIPFRTHGRSAISREPDVDRELTTGAVGSRLHGPLNGLHGALMSLRLAAMRAVGAFDQCPAPADRPLEMAFRLGERWDLNGVGMRDGVAHPRAMPALSRGCQGPAPGSVPADSGVWNRPPEIVGDGGEARTDEPDSLAEAFLAHPEPLRPELTICSIVDLNVPLGVQIGRHFTI